MRKIMMTMLALGGLGMGLAQTAQAAPVAAASALQAPGLVEQIKNGGGKFKGHKGWKQGHGYGRVYGGPPPHARAYGRRARDAGYYRYW